MNLALNDAIRQYYSQAFGDHTTNTLCSRQESAQLRSQLPRDPAATDVALYSGCPPELLHWLNYCSYVVPTLQEQYQLEPGPLPPFSLSYPLQSLRLDNDAVQRTLTYLNDTADDDTLGDHTQSYQPGHHRCDTRQAQQAQLAQQALLALSSTGFDIHDAPGDWPKNYLAWVLRTIDLREADLRKANLSGADLSGLHLEQVDLRGADLTHCDLTKAVIKLCDLRGADLTGATLSEASISECNFEDAILVRADLTACKVEYSQFTHSDCTEICLEGAGLEHVDFFEAQLAHADLHNAVIRQCIFEKAQMMATELTRASIDDTDLRGAVMTRALLRNTDVHNCDLRRANLDTADATGIQFLNTRLEDATFKVLPSSCETIVYSIHNPGYGEASPEEEANDTVESSNQAYKTIDRASYDHNLSGLRKERQPNGIALDDGLMISKYQLPIDIDRRLRQQFDRQFAAYDSEPEGSYLDDISDSDSDSGEDNGNNVIDTQNAAPIVSAPRQSWTALAIHILWMVDLQSISDFLTMRYFAHAATRYVHAQQAARNIGPRLAYKAANNKPVVPRRPYYRQGSTALAVLPAHGLK